MIPSGHQDIPFSVALRLKPCPFSGTFRRLYDRLNQQTDATCRLPAAQRMGYKSGYQIRKANLHVSRI